MKHSGKIIALAYPDTYVTMSTEWVCKLLPLFGLGTKEYIKAGHAALVLVENRTGALHYFDFGRYVTPKGHGRVRGANTDAELSIPITGQLSNKNTLQNLEEILIWLDANPQKTHGEGRLLASVCDAINFEKAETFIHELQQKGSIPYGAFQKKGSNCARFVTDTLLAATTDQKIIKTLKHNKKFTPSTVGNVEKASTQKKVFQVRNGLVEEFNGTALKENLSNYFHKKRPAVQDTHLLETQEKFSKDASFQKLSGTGSDAWFKVVSAHLPPYHFNIQRYNNKGEMDYNGVYVSSDFDTTLPFQFTYDSHCGYCHILQLGKKIKLEGVGSLQEFSSLQKQRSA